MDKFDFTTEEGHQQFVEFIKQSVLPQTAPQNLVQTPLVAITSLPGKGLGQVKSIQNWEIYKPGYIKSAYFDASAIVKLVNKDGPQQSQDDARIAFRHFCPIKTTGICFAEALGVLKRKMLKKDIDTSVYRGAVYGLHVMADQQNLQVDSLLASFKDLIASDDLVHRYPDQIDFSDALQIVSVKKAAVAGEWYLCTADKGLRDVASGEGINVVFLP